MAGLCKSVLSIIRAKQTMYAVSQLMPVGAAASAALLPAAALSPSVVACQCCANASRMRSIFCASPGSRKPESSRRIARSRLRRFEIEALNVGSHERHLVRPSEQFAEDAHVEAGRTVQPSCAGQRR